MQQLRIKHNHFSDKHMDPFKIRNNGDLMKYWSGVQQRPWRNVTEQDKRQQQLTDKWNQFISDHACPNYISMNFNKDGSRKQKRKVELCKKPAHCVCSDECFDCTNLIMDEEEKIMNDQPLSQPYDPTELVSLPSYVTDIQQGMLPCDDEILTFMEEDHQYQVKRNVVEKEAYMDEMEAMLDSIPSSQPGFNPDELFTPVLSQNDEHTSILAYDSQRTISVQSNDDHSGLFSDLSQHTTVSYDSEGYDGSVELTPPTPVK